MFNNTIKALQISFSEQLMLFAAYYVGAGCSAIIGSILFSRMRKIGLLSWVVSGVIMTLLLTAIADNMPINILICAFLGVSIGIGLPSCLAFFADVTTVENRGVYGGITYGAVGLGTLILGLWADTLSIAMGFLALAIFRALGLVVFLFSARDGVIGQARAIPRYQSILQRREVTLYLIPWIMFSLINFAETPIFESMFGELRVLMGFIEFALSGLFALVGGFLADRVGRKRVVIAGFVMLGIGYAILSLFSGISASWYVYTTFDGIAWGMFAAVFFMTLWGDLAEQYDKAKYYALGGLPFLLAGILPVIVEHYAEAIGTVTAFSLASFFLFLAVVPLMYASETLPEKSMRDRELKQYIEHAKKTKEKYT
jgi:MFS family permease